MKVWYIHTIGFIFAHCVDQFINVCPSSDLPDDWPLPRPVHHSGVSFSCLSVGVQ